MSVQGGNDDDDREDNDSLLGQGREDRIGSFTTSARLMDLRHQDLIQVRESLSYINPFKKRSEDKHLLDVLMQEFTPSGENLLVHNNLRGLLDYITSIAEGIETASLNPNVKRRRSTVLMQHGESHGAIAPRIRDLRILDFNFNPSENFSVVVRRHAVLISVDPLRAVVMASRMIVMVPPGGMDSIFKLLGSYMKCK